MKKLSKHIRELKLGFNSFAKCLYDITSANALESKKLIESYVKMYDYDNEEFENQCTIIAKDIIDIVKETRTTHNLSDLKKYTIGSIYSVNDRIKYESVYLEYDLKLDWIDKILIFVSGRYLYDLNSNTYLRITGSNDSMVVDNTSVYAWNDSLDKLVLVKSDYDLTVENNKIPTYTFNENRVEIATIMFIIPDLFEWNEYDISFIIQHEIRHIRDLFLYTKTLELMNKDILLGHIQKISYIKNSDLRVCNILTNENYSDTMKISEIKNNMTFAALEYFFAEQSVYILNMYEMVARLSNFKGEIKKHYQEIIRQRSSILENPSNIAYKFSKTYRQYEELLNTLRMLVDYLDNGIKKRFAQTALQDYYSKKTITNTYPYNRDFKVNGLFNEQSFDDFFNFHIERIQNIFLDRAVDYIKDMCLTESFQFDVKHNIRTSFPYLHRNNNRVLY